MPAPVQLLQQLLLQQAVSADAEAAGTEVDRKGATAGLQQYVAELLQHLQEAAVVHEVSSSSCSNTSVQCMSTVTCPLCLLHHTKETYCSSTCRRQQQCMR
jgi:hypothetical protein